MTVTGQTFRVTPAKAIITKTYSEIDKKLINPFKCLSNFILFVDRYCKSGKDLYDGREGSTAPVI